MNDSDDLPEDVQTLVSAVTESGPELIWHYTNADGLLGILKSGAIWATDAAYVNDTAELVYTLDEVRKAVVKATHGADRRAIEVLLKRLAGDDFGAVVIACFCADGDLLSQWRGYSASGGFSIGFNTGELARHWMVRESVGLLAPINYSETDAREAVSRWTDSALEKWGEILPDGIDALIAGRKEVTDELVDEFAPLAQRLDRTLGHLRWAAAFHKHPSFSEEQEWRLTTSGMSSEDVALGFRTTPLGLVPYRSIAFQEDSQESPIRCVRVGPGSNADLQMTAVRRLLSELDYTDVEVVKSATPFRG